MKSYSGSHLEISALVLRSLTYGVRLQELARYVRYNYSVDLHWDHNC